MFRRRRKKNAPCVVLNLTCTHDRSVRMLLLSGSPGGEEHSNDLVTAMRKNRVISFLQRRENIKVPTDPNRKCVKLSGVASCFLVHYF